jgi:hypothetical protein
MINILQPQSYPLRKTGNGDLLVNHSPSPEPWPGTTAHRSRRDPAGDHRFGLYDQQRRAPVATKSGKAQPRAAGPRGSDEAGHVATSSGPLAGGRDLESQSAGLREIEATIGCSQPRRKEEQTWVGKTNRKPSISSIISDWTRVLVRTGLVHEPSCEQRELQHCSHHQSRSINPRQYL